MTLIARPTTAALNLFVTKPIAIFVWLLSEAANRTCFHDRAQLRRLVRRARREGRPVILASNHISMFDDPVLPMSLLRTGPRSAAELLGLAVLVGLFVAGPAPLAGSRWVGGLTLAAVCAAAFLGAHKTWWSLGDLVNFSGTSALRGKLEAGGSPRRAWLLRGLLRVADPVIFHFMRSGAVKTVLVDRRPGADAKDARARAVDATVEIAARAEPVWVFFEGRRSRDPQVVGPARSGVGSIALELARRGLQPSIFAIHHGGLERVIPIASRRWLSGGHRIEVRWCEVKPGILAAAHCPDEAQQIADQIRDAVVSLQPDSRAGTGAAR